MNRDKIRKYIFYKLAMARFSSVLKDAGMKDEFIKTAKGSGMDLLGWLSGTARATGQQLKDELTGRSIRGPGLTAKPEQIRRWNIAQALRQQRSGLKEMVQSGKLTPAQARAKALSQGKYLKSLPGKSVSRAGSGLMARTGRTLGRGFTSLLAAGAVGDMYHAATRKREKGSGFFESLGRRTGRIGRNLAFFTPGAVGGGAFAYELASSAGLAPGFGELGASAGRVADKGVRAVRSTGRKIRQIFGGGESFEKQRRKALGDVRRPKAKIDQANKFNLKAGYND